MAHLLGGLPGQVESLRLTYIHCLPSEQAMVVPASLRALCVKAVGRNPPADSSGPTPDLTFGLHAGLERLCLVLWESRVGLQCLDAGAATGLRELIVQARAVGMDSHLAAQVAAAGPLAGALRLCRRDEWSVSKT